MKRRDFLNLTAGSALAAAVPLPTRAAATAGAPKRLYVWAVAMAHAGNPISQRTLSQALHVPAAEAAAVMRRLIARGVVGAPNAAGVARAAAPAFRASAFVQSAKAVGRASATDLAKGLRGTSKTMATPEGTQPNLVTTPEGPSSIRADESGLDVAEPSQADACARPEDANAAHSTE